ncbi:MAG TPA: peroxiredoxin [Thermoplasmata archaeon]|nr:peroxiredoxin [Thermoplasmata archaeon]
MIDVGEAAPDFEAPSSDGRRVHLTELRGHPVVLFFFPKANTSGCSRETRGFAELAPRLSERGVHLVGISVDDLATQTGFARACHAAFPIVADPRKGIAAAYGVLGMFGFAKRVTFFLGPDGVVLDKVAAGLPGPHLARARERFLSDR